MNRLLLYLLLFVIPLLLPGQNRLTDSLEQVLLTTLQDTLRVDILNKLTHRYKRSNIKRALELSEQAEQLAQQLNYKKGLAATYYSRAYVYYPMGEHDEAISFAQKSIAIAEAEKDTNRLAYSNALLAMIHQRISDYDLSIHHNKVSAKHFAQLKDTLILAAVTSNMGNIFEERGQYDTALVYYFESLKYKVDSGNKKLATVQLANIDACYNMLGEYALSLKYNREALMQTDTNQHYLSGVLMTNRGDTFLAMNELDSALHCGLLAEQHLSNLNVPYLQINADKLLGGVYNALGKKEHAIRYYTKGIALSESIGNLDYQTKIACELGGIYLSNNEFTKAEGVLEKAYQIARQLNGFPNLKCNADLLAKVYEAKGDYQKAFQFLKESHTYQDSMANLEKTLKLIELEKQYKTEVQSKKIAQQELTIALQDAKQRNYIIFFLLAFLLLSSFFFYFRYQQKIQHKETEMTLQLEKTKASQLEEIDHLKSNFFANISHEFRTPLTLILAPLKKMMENPSSDDPDRYYPMMHRNGNRLLQLINQLLDLSKLDAGKMKLQVTEGDLRAFLKALTFSFESLAERKRIHFQTRFPEQKVVTYFDRDKVEKIVTNLLSNAFKFTPHKGSISVEVSISGDYLRWVIQDSGPGIPKKEIDHIFDRFYQAKDAQNKSGTGIGLSLVKELVELHKGQISLLSDEGHGTRIKVSLPLGQSFYTEEEIIKGALYTDTNVEIPAELLEEVGVTISPSNSKSKGNQPLLLLVEDNKDLLHFIAESLQQEYRIQTAENGTLGLELATNHIPDLIISDVMMPEMDGLTLCEKLKTNEKTSHIPVILLTAKGTIDNKIEGLETGADDYLTKPFDNKELHIRVANLIEQRRKLRARFSREMQLKPSEIAITSADEIFMNKVLRVIEDNLSNEFFGVEELSKSVAMSRSQIHRKLSAICGQPASKIIRNLRLQRGKQLLENGAGTVSEIAYEVGFNSPAYFAKCFNDQFGISPSSVGK